MEVSSELTVLSARLRAPQRMGVPELRSAAAVVLLPPTTSSARAWTPTLGAAQRRASSDEPEAAAKSESCPQFSRRYPPLQPEETLLIGRR
jgi:hypothetical protein